MTSAEGFKVGSAYLDLDIRDQTPEGLRRIKERIERGDHVAIPIRIDDPDEAAFREKLLAAVKSIHPVVQPTFGDPVTPQWKQDTDEKTRRYKPPPVKTTATDPIDAAWRAKIQASIRAIAADAIKIPMVLETAKYREELELAVGELNSTLTQKIPVDMDGADQFRLHVEELAKEVSAEVTAHIPVEIDRDKARADAETAAADISRSFTSVFGNGIAPMPAVIGAAVLAAGPLVGGAMIGIAGLGMAAFAATIAARTPQVSAAWGSLMAQLTAEQTAAAPMLAEPIANALDVVRGRIALLGPEIRADLVTAESAVKPLTEGLLGLVQGALPGLTMALVRQGPVMQGFKTLLTDTGQAVGDTFSSLSEHAKAFGVDTASLGRIVQSAMGLITNVTNQTGEAWASNSGQITGAVGQLMSGLGQLSGSVIPALTSELANVLSVLGLLAEGAGAVEHAVGPLAGDLTALAISAKLLGVNLTAIPGQLSALPEKLAEVAAGGGRFAGVSGLLAGVLPAVGTGLGVVAAGFGLVALGASTAAAHERDLIDAGTQLGHSVIVGGTAASDAGKKLNDMEDSTNKLKVQIQQLAGQANAGTTAINEYGGGYSVTASKSVEFQGKLQDLNIELKAATDAENDYIKELGPMGVAQARAAQAQKDYNDALTKYGAGAPETEAASKKLASANAEVTSQQQNLNNALSLTKATMGTFSKPAEVLKQDLAKIGDAASTDSDKIKAMKDALIQLSGGAIPVGDAMEAIDKALSGINSQLVQGIPKTDGYGKALLNADGSIRTVTKNGQDLRDTIGDLRGKFVDAAAAIVAQDEAQGKSAVDAKAHAQAVLEQQIPAIEKLGGAMGLTKDQVDNALKAMGAWPKDLVTVVATPGVLQAQSAMDILRGKVLDVPNDHTVHTNALTDEAMNALRALGLVVTTLPDGTVTITGNTALAQQAAEDQVARINAMRAAIHVTVQSDGSAVQVTPGGRVAVTNATGNLFVPMADGGFGGRTLTPMGNDVAQVVAPNTWRISGDRRDVSELFAPLDGSQRSASLIRQAAQHEGLTSHVPTQRSVTINQTVITTDPQQAADKAAGAVAWAMSSARG